MNTIVYLIRHSTKFDPTSINIYNTKDNSQIKTEKKMLSVEGENRARTLSKEEEFDNVDAVYCSNYVRSMQTAKYFLLKKNLKLNIDDRFNERKKGDYCHELYPNFISGQYWNGDLKCTGGESRNEVSKRMLEAFWEVVEDNKNKTSVIISHGTAISFLLMNWCKLLSVDENYLRIFEYKDRILINRLFKAPEVFRIIVNEEKKIVDIQNIEFEDLK